MSAVDKTCFKCGEVKPLSAYWRRAASKDGYNASCKACGMAVKRRSNTASCAHYRATHRQQYRDYQRVYNAQWVLRNPEKRAEHQRRAHLRRKLRAED